MRCGSSSPASAPSASGTRGICARCAATASSCWRTAGGGCRTSSPRRSQRDDSRNVEAELGVTVFDDLDEALAARPDAVFVCTPSSQHLEIAQRAADAGCHLFIEKPVSHTLDGVERAARHRGGEADWSRWSAASGAITRASGGCASCCRRRRSGRSCGAEIDYGEYLPDWHPYEDYRTSYAARAELGGGVVLTQIHDYDLAWWLFGAPRTVTATGGHLSDLEIDVEDTVDAQLEGGAVPVTRPAELRVAAAAAHDHASTANSGSVTLDLLTGAHQLDARDLASAGAFADYQRNQMFMDEVRHFLACLAGRRAPGGAAGGRRSPSCGSRWRSRTRCARAARVEVSVSTGPDFSLDGTAWRS